MADSTRGPSAWRRLIARRMTRRGLIQAGGVGAATATAVIVGLDRPSEAAAAPAGTSALRAISPANLVALDPHAFAGIAPAAQPGQDTQPALRIFPIDRAKFLAGARFDLRIEATGVDPATARITIEVAGSRGAEPLLRGEPVRSAPTDTSLAVTYTGLSYERPGRFTVSAALDVPGAAPVVTAVTHDVVLAQTSGKKVKNVIFFLGDGMGQSPITAARLLSKGISEGKYHGLLEMDLMDYRGLVTTSGTDSIATDSANSMSAYMTGHKSAVNAMGVYATSEPDPNKHPRQENMAEILKRTRGMSIGVVTTAEVQDATPAAVWAHTRRRAEYMEIMDQALRPEQMPDVLMGGGSASFLPQSQPGSRRKDDRDLGQEFMARGFAFAASRGQLREVMAQGTPDRLLGLFHTGNMNVYLDRQHRPNPAVLGQFNDQPTLIEMTQDALAVLEKNPRGFFLMVEGASIDKMEHPLDWQRAVYDAIELDQAIGVAKRWAAGRDDTLIVVTADHNHSMSVVGTNDRARGEGRQGNGVYAGAGFPNFVDADGDGFPDDPDPERTLFVGWSNHPDYRDDFRADPVFSQPAVADRTLPANANVVPNPGRDPGAELQVGNLPLNTNNSVHTVDDIAIVASGPGSARFNGVLDNTEVFFAIMDALGLDARVSG